MNAVPDLRQRRCICAKATWARPVLQRFVDFVREVQRDQFFAAWLRQMQRSCAVKASAVFLLPKRRFRHGAPRDLRVGTGSRPLTRRAPLRRTAGRLAIGSGFGLAAPRNRNHRLRLRKQKPAFLVSVRIAPLESRLVRLSGIEIFSRLKTLDPERDGGIGRDIIFGKHPKALGLGKFLRCTFCQHGLAVEKHHTGLEWLLRFELWVRGGIERLDVSNLLDRDVFGSDGDDVLHGNLRGAEMVSEREQ